MPSRLTGIDALRPSASDRTGRKAAPGPRTAKLTERRVPPMQVLSWNGRQILDELSGPGRLV